MDARNCLETLETILSSARNGDLQGRHDLLGDVTELQRHADEQFRKGNIKFYHVSVTASEALTLVSSAKASSFDSFSVEKVLFHGPAAVAALTAVSDGRIVDREPAVSAL